MTEFCIESCLTTRKDNLFPLKSYWTPNFVFVVRLLFRKHNIAFRYSITVWYIFAGLNSVDCCLDPGDVTEAPVSWGPAAYTLHPPAPRLPGLQAHAPVLPAKGRGPGILTSRMSTISEN
jgi:hypothetical protein